MHRTFSNYSPSSFLGLDPDPDQDQDPKEAKSHRPMIRTEYT